MPFASLRRTVKDTKRPCPADSFDAIGTSRPWRSPVVDGRISRRLLFRSIADAVVALQIGARPI